jgi:hypothetical protein
MAAPVIGLLAQQELAARLQKEAQRLRWATWVRDAAIHGLEEELASPSGMVYEHGARARLSALIARQHQELDRLSELQATIQRAEDGQLKICDLCGAAMGLEACAHVADGAPSEGIAGERLVPALV